MSWNNVKEEIKPVYGLINFHETREMAEGSFEYIYRDILDIKSNFIRLGFHLAECRDMEYYHDYGYSDFYEFVDKNFHMDKSEVSRCINVFMAFSGTSGEYGTTHGMWLDDKYKDYSYSQLKEMLSLDEKKRQQIKPEMTIKQIRDLKKKWSGKVPEVATSQQQKEVFCTSFPGIVCNIEEVMKKHFTKNGNIEGCAGCCRSCLCVKSCKYVCGVGLYTRNYIGLEDHLDKKDQTLEPETVEEKTSAYGTSKRVYPDDDSFNVVGCEGDHDCFDCSMDCDIRQKNCYCREAPLSNPFDCTTVNVLKNLQSEVGNKCQFVNRDLAIQKAGQIPDPCCKFCEDKCGYRCNRSVQQNYEEELKVDIVQTVEYQEVQQPEEVKQPELPVLKNNEQRKDFIDGYRSWPVWIDQQLTGEKYYRYDLSNKVAIVVKVNRKHAWKDYKESNDYEYAAEQYYLLGIKTTWSSKGTKIVEDESRTFYECNTNKTALVDYLKEYQKSH